MYSSNNLPWRNINDFLVDVGEIKEPKKFCMQVANKISRLLSYDQGRIYFLNNAGQIDDEILIGVEDGWGAAYREYYSKIDNSRYAIPTRAYQNLVKRKEGYYALPRFGGGVYNWEKYKIGNTEFASNYLQAQRIKHTASFVFHGTDNIIKAVCILDRTSNCEYSPKEIGIMSIIQPHLDNLYENLFVLVQPDAYITSSSNQNILTRRETEIAELMVRGLTPKKVSGNLSISLSTVYRHIANIHKKLNVSNRQELLLKLIEP